MLKLTGLLKLNRAVVVLSLFIASGVAQAGEVFTSNFSSENRYYFGLQLVQKSMTASGEQQRSSLPATPSAVNTIHLYKNSTKLVQKKLLSIGFFEKGAGIKYFF